MSAQRNRRITRQNNCGKGQNMGTRARDFFFFSLHLRKHERTRCSVEKAIAAKGKRWVGFLIEEA